MQISAIQNYSPVLAKMRLAKKKPCSENIVKNSTAESFSIEKKK